MRETRRDVPLESMGSSSDFTKSPIKRAVCPSFDPKYHPTSQSNARTDPSIQAALSGTACPAPPPRPKENAGKVRSNAAASRTTKKVPARGTVRARASSRRRWLSAAAAAAVAAAAAEVVREASVARARERVPWEMERKREGEEQSGQNEGRTQPRTSNGRGAGLHERGQTRETCARIQMLFTRNLSSFQSAKVPFEDWLLPP